MRLLLSFEIALLLVAAALLSRSRARSRPLPVAAAPRPRPPQDPRQSQVAGTAPYEALLAIQERLADMQRHLPSDSADARWLEGYRNDLRNVLDDVYWELYHSSG
jgi:hypothetical protein